ncbi:MAG: thiamine pyrophosphate-dependent dehydrogenase E1 component subunit alpha [Anaerolineales bacterium]|nr:thiamine pyrophosphate-dependent dehydrogenase E1 component subunit alpha [Anaerolineales bacterium]
MRSASQLSDLYRMMLRIRRFEEEVLSLFPSGLIQGTSHTYIGQKANAVGVLAWMEEGDVVMSTHRCHGHFLTYGGSMHALAAEMMKRSTGVCGGRGGSQHAQWKNFYANGILGGTIPLAVGRAFAEKASGEGRIVFAFMGDGTLGEGVVYDSLNMASLWGLPVLFVVENNRYAQSTPVHMHLAGDISRRFESFDIPACEVEADDVLKVLESSKTAVDKVRRDGGPQALILQTYRFAPHSKGDDMRDQEEISSYKERDPLQVHAKQLDPTQWEQIDAEVLAEVKEAFSRAKANPLSDPKTLSSTLGAD